jgi:hypothetical protein
MRTSLGGCIPENLAWPRSGDSRAPKDADAIGEKYATYTSLLLKVGNADGRTKDHHHPEQTTEGLKT